MPNRQATYDDANLILRLFELRREAKLRDAREWFVANFHASTVEEMDRLAPRGTKENAYVRMVVSYWDMAASFVTSGVLSQELFLQSAGELTFVWERLRAVVPGVREKYNRHYASHLEAIGNVGLKSIEANGPEALASFQAMVHGPLAAAKS